MKKKKGLTRREFIKKVGTTASVLGVSTVLPGMPKLVRAGSKDHILIGRPLPLTGPVAAFSESSPWLDNRALAAINKDGGIYIKEYGKKLPVKVKILDTESNPTKAGELASRLILKDKIDVMYVSSTPATVSPVSGVCERFKVPSVSTMMPCEMFLHGGKYDWCFNASMSVVDFLVAFIEAWDQVETNKVVGLCAQNDPDGIAWAEGARKALAPKGYKLVDLGRFPVGTNDYTTQINGWKKGKVEILFANMSPPDFITMWRQCHRNGFIPKMCTAGRAGLFSSTIEAIGGDLGVGVTSEAVWLPSYPFKSSLSGETAKEFADAYEKASGKQWSQPLGGLYTGYEILADALRRAETLDREAIRRALADTDLQALQGPIKFTKENIAVTPSGCLQWVKGKKFPFEAVLVANGNYANLPVQRKAVSIHKLRGIS
ncbi:MAG: ABC transporter substrate-binding protein [Deltaproteobacteria bacterium]|nr:ABC transporter substrate-binding protein [Deltaproteobacteria bacterium]MBW2138317.1 ABC transporter substrate-binding protein [Deltaproteobacteria bacterium]